jgi:hypothetical protein
MLTRCWNDTIRLTKYPLPPTAAEGDQAVAIDRVEWKDGDDLQTVYYRNGSIGLMRQSSGAFVGFVRAPEYLWSPSNTSNDSMGNQIVKFGNGTVLTKRPLTPANASLYDQATAQVWTRDYANGTTETKFANGTFIRIVRSTSGTNATIYYLQRVDGSVSAQPNGSIAIAF